MILKSIGFFIIGFTLTSLILSKINTMLREGNSIKPNYRNEFIPLCAGIVFVPVITVLSLISILIINENQYILILSFLVGTLAMGLAGFMDDMLGNRKVTGLKGHLLSFTKGQLTTGAFKALYGGLMALFISIIISNTVIDIFINTLIIALFTNAINLLDLRPGRALKGYLFFSIILVILYPINHLNMILFGLIGSVVSYMPSDLKAKSMMGDVGSNILGVSLGIICATGTMYVRIIYLIFLILFHIYTEKFSLTKTIEKNKFLRYIDGLGR